MDTPHHIIFVLHRLPLHIILNYFQNINKILRNFLWGHGTSITEIGTASSQKWSIYSLPNGISIHKEEEHLPYQPTQTVYSGWDTGGLRGSWTISGGWGGGSPHEWGGGDVLSVRTFFPCPCSSYVASLPRGINWLSTWTEQESFSVCGHGTPVVLSTSCWCDKLD